MIRHRYLLRSILTDLFMFSLLFCLAVPTLRIFGTSPLTVWFAFVLIIPFSALSTARMIGNLPLFLLSHILLTAWPLLTQTSTGIRLTIFFFMLFSAIYSVATRLHGGWRFQFSSAFLGMILAAIITIVLDYFDIDGVSGPLRLCAFIILICYIICEQTSRVDNSLDILRDTARQPVDITLRYNNSVLFPFITLCGIAALFSGFVPVSKMLGILWSGIKLILKLLLYLLPSNNAEVEPEPEPLQPEQAPDFRDMLPEAEGSSLLVQILEILLFVVGWAVAIAVVILVITHAVKYFLGRFYAARSGGDDLREYIGPVSNRDKQRKKSNKQRPRIPFFGMTPAEKIRRAYYKKVSRHIRKGAGILKTDTVSDIEKKLQERENLSEITSQYNPSRYRPPEAAIKRSATL